MTLLRWSFVCLMLGFAAGMLASHDPSPVFAGLGTLVLYLMLTCSVVLGMLGAVVFPRM